ncbi:MAG: alpha amylase C-terminal domain-containing protein, partial [Bacteroidota bacterium]
PLSHDEVVHGKGTLLTRMPGNNEQRFSNLRALYGYMFTHPGTKLLFMGGEIGQTTEWNIEKGVDWGLLEHEHHAGMKAWVSALNRLYTSSTALYEQQFDQKGFEWINHGDHQKSVLSYQRKGKDAKDRIVVVCNFTPVPYEGFRVGVPTKGSYEEVLNSNATTYGGTGDLLNHKAIKAEVKEWDGLDHSIAFDLAPFGVTIFRLKTIRRKKKS